MTRLGRHAELALAPFDLTVAQFRALGSLIVKTAQGTDLAHRLGVTPPTVSALVDGLVRRGLVERSGDVDDRRRINHVVTDRGRSLYREVEAATAARLDAVLAFARTPTEAGRLRESLEEFNALLDAWLDDDRGKRPRSDRR